MRLATEQDCDRPSATRRPHDSKGAILVEMAFALPLMTIIFLSIIDLGLIVREYQLVQNAAREGARISSLPQYYLPSAKDPTATLAAIQNQVVQYCAQEKIVISAGDVTVNQNYPITIGAGTACGSEITVTYTRPLLLLGRPFFMFGPMVLHGRAIFHNLYGC